MLHEDLSKSELHTHACHRNRRSDTLPAVISITGSRFESCMSRRYPPSIATDSMLGASLFRALSKSWGVLQTQVLHRLLLQVACMVCCISIYQNVKICMHG